MAPHVALSRRHFIKLTSIAGTAALGAAQASAAEPTAGAGRAPARLSADEALRELLAGNERFAAGRPVSPRRSPADFQEVAGAQYPFAAILSCADSRVSPEILFDVGKGDIFVVRVAGNVVTGAGVASGIDFALKLAAILEGEDVARQIQLQIEYDPAPPFDSGSPRTAAPAIVAALRARLAPLNEQRREVARRVGQKLGVPQP